LWFDRASTVSLRPELRPSGSAEPLAEVHPEPFENLTAPRRIEGEDRGAACAKKKEWPRRRGAIPRKRVDYTLVTLAACLPLGPSTMSNSTV
jgi:hypothetical protein